MYTSVSPLINWVLWTKDFFFSMPCTCLYKGWSKIKLDHPWIFDNWIIKSQWVWSTSLPILGSFRRIYIICIPIMVHVQGVSKTLWSKLRPRTPLRPSANRTFERPSLAVQMGCMPVGHGFDSRHWHVSLQPWASCFTSIASSFEGDGIAGPVWCNKNCGNIHPNGPKKDWRANAKNNNMTLGMTDFQCHL